VYACSAFGLFNDMARRAVPYASAALAASIVAGQLESSWTHGAFQFRSRTSLPWKNNAPLEFAIRIVCGKVHILLHADRKDAPNMYGVPGGARLSGNNATIR
jgi:hypothetical protein